MNTIHIERMDLNLLVVLQAVYLEGGITRAAQRLHVTQPAVSHALRRLRGLLGDPLFVRQGSGTVPTPFTHRLMGPVQAALATLQAGLAGGQGYDPATMPRSFRLGIRDALETLALPGLHERLLRASPGSRLLCQPIDRVRLASDLARGTLDCAVDIPIRVGEDVASERLAGSDGLVVMARADHPALRGGRLSLKAYLAHPHVAVSSRRSGLTPEDAALAGLGHRRDVVLRLQSHAVALEVVAREPLLLTLPRQRVAELKAPEALLAHGLPFKVPPVEYRLYWHTRQQDDPAQRWLRGQIAQVFAEAAEAAGRVR